ncbi:MAG: hypothetical protein E6Q36_01165 [Chryseobacterium sp.]|nr:MAG: hypothetical protein E6Q36_01165 [Chryseobacterium sp.]
MFKLTIHDRNGVELKEGDIVKIIVREEFQFFCEVKYLEGDKVLTPFHTFSFHSVEKIDKVPEKAIKSKEERYNIWFMPTKKYDDQGMEAFSKYLMSWRQCEHLLEKRMWRIERLTNNKKL